MKLNTQTLVLTSLFVATAVFAQDNQPDSQSASPSEQIRSGIERILTPAESTAGAQRMTAKESIGDWKQKPKEVAQKLIDKYGQPDEVTARRLVWYNTGQWKRTEIMNEETKHDFPIPHTDFLKQTIDYRVPPDKFDDLARFDGSVVADRTQGELSARCDKEEHNLLAINVARDVVNGDKTPEEARDFFAETVMASKNGEKPDYMQRLHFDVARIGTGDPDKTSAITEAAGAEPDQQEQK